MPGAVRFGLRRTSGLGKKRKVFSPKSRTGAEVGISEEVAVKSLTVHDSHVNPLGTPLMVSPVRANGRSLFREDKRSKMT
ncbi:hypothetical protein ABH19_13675 [Leptospirillum sp. Group II 'CF-1']|nr:hypothetical protein ABH19_00985 [Leptospirillum sp. Group II 'CF-1']AKS22670.1 hypothetical protein ABH19_01230 [Leptospirillum sp. Group II 'CF-1']AKS22714.1 hypothetical protein ABH19_01530 [Leptospirillum sp. Group II 'CF-1']AKS22811.1 hypothetical protein ABH19_02160 [Leptospirillum sp. Group II 'CF-1']AKS22901.1 hypothetical protein ABH19_02760 [Leptospirillum sp. Group II 'CF-1']